MMAARKFRARKGPIPCTSRRSASVAFMIACRLPKRPSSARADIVETVVAFAIQIQNYRLLLKLGDQNVVRYLHSIRKRNGHGRAF